MDIREIKYFYEITQSQSLEQAANQLFITQPSLTKAIHKLEDELGIKLFEKAGRKNVLTKQGHEFLSLAKPVLEAYTHFEENLSFIGKTERATVKYGVIPLYQTPFTSAFLYAFRKKYPYISVQIHELDEETIQHQLISGELDIGMTENMLISPYLITYSGFEDVVSVAVGEDSPYYHASSLTFADLKDAVFNIVTSGHNNYNQIISNCHRAGFEPNIAYESSQIGLLLDYTILNKGVCIFNRCMIYDNIMAYPHLQKMRIIPLDPPPLCFCWVTHRRQEKMTKAVKIFADELTEALTLDTAKRIQ